ncbi:hypothetical protein [Methylobacterium brachythecii]|uniref:Uncharacterized protein n=1 Tax=Methylobacterium brachythecii TaxID=1176177 RepID=A0A7W6AE39_9HYPH|nr:hypothetical protein [Methylobacterium brachythecii]MBB3901613.1 hypothetical protein [Methylobacterium brachythecii]
MGRIGCVQPALITLNEHGYASFSEASVTMGTNRSSARIVLAACLATVLLPAGGCMKEATAPAAAAGTMRERIAALALRQIDFGAISLIPVRFEKSRIAGPFEDGGRSLYCVTSHMKGRSLDKAERPKAVIRDAGGVLTVLRDEDEVCEGHRTEPFTELDSKAT